jgi:DNA-binding transcriptional ArsR family regulator
LTIKAGGTTVKPMLNNAPVDRVFHALAEPTRRAIVERLSGGPLSVTDLAQPFGVTLAAIVQHLQVLEESGVIRSEKVGRVRTCRIDSAGLSLAERWLQERRRLWEHRLDRLGALLAEEEDDDEPKKQQTKKRKRP